jgi:hypothetical protein
VDGLTLTTIPFPLRGTDGLVTVQYGANDDPVRWGYAVLQLDWFRPELVRGYPVMQASVACPAEGYAADMGWLQVVRYEIRDPGEEGTVTVFDTRPQLAETGMPYAAFGIRPTFFDAPSIEGLREVNWHADTFLVFTPDAVMSRVLRPLCGFNWGFRIHEGKVFLDPSIVADAGDWEKILPDLRERFPSWTFENGDSYRPTT